MSRVYLLIELEYGDVYMINTEHIEYVQKTKYTYEKTEVDYIIIKVHGKTLKFAKHNIKRLKFLNTDVAMYQHIQMLLENGQVD